MYICGKFTKNTEGALARKTVAVAREVEIKPDGKSVMCDFTFNPDTKKIEVHKGTHVICITDSVGFFEKATVSFVAMRNGIMVKLLSGAMYITDGGAQVAKLMSDGTNSPLTTPNKIRWFKVDELADFVKFEIAKEFSVHYDSDLKDYVNNLEFISTCENKVEKGVQTFFYHCDEIVKSLGKEDFVSNTTDKPFEVVDKKPKNSAFSILADIEYEDSKTADEDDGF